MVRLFWLKLVVLHFCIIVVIGPKVCLDTGDLCSVGGESCFYAMYDRSPMQSLGRRWYPKVYNTYGQEGSYTYQISLAPSNSNDPEIYHVASKKCAKLKILENCCGLRADQNQSCILGVPEENENYYFIFDLGDRSKHLKYFASKIKLNPIDWCHDVEKSDERWGCMDISDNQIQRIEYPYARIDIYRFNASFSNVNMTGDSAWRYITKDVSFDELKNKIHVNDDIVTPVVVKGVTDLKNITHEKHRKGEVPCFYVLASATGNLVTSKPVCYLRSVRYYTHIATKEDKNASGNPQNSGTFGESLPKSTEEQGREALVAVVCVVVVISILIIAFVTRHLKRVWIYMHPEYTPENVEGGIHEVTWNVMLQESEARDSLMKADTTEEYDAIGTSLPKHVLPMEKNNNEAVTRRNIEKDENPEMSVESEVGLFMASSTEIVADEPLAVITYVITNNSSYKDSTSESASDASDDTLENSGSSLDNFWTQFDTRPGSPCGNDENLANGYLRHCADTEETTPVPGLYVRRTSEPLVDSGIASFISDDVPHSNFGTL